MCCIRSSRSVCRPLHQGAPGVAGAGRHHQAMGQFAMRARATPWSSCSMRITVIGPGPWAGSPGAAGGTAPAPPSACGCSGPAACLQVVGQAMRALGAVGMHRLHAARQAHQLGQLQAVALVEALQDVGDQLVGRGLRQSRSAPAGSSCRRARSASSCAAPGPASPTACAASACRRSRSRAGAVEQRGGAGDAAGQVAQRAIEQVGGHGGVLVGDRARPWQAAGRPSMASRIRHLRALRVS
jgi:hypothetical protein